MATNTFRRYIWLLDILERYGYADFKTIQEEWSRSGLNAYNEDFPRRTFRNHIEAISDQFCIDILYKSGLGYYISNPDDLKETRMKQWLISTLSTYNTLIDCQDMKDKILFENVPSSQGNLPMIIRALRSRVSVSFSYQSHFSTEPHLVEAEPYCLKLFKQRWYMLGKVADCEDLRIYALERMTDLDETSHSYSIPEKFDAEIYFENYYGIIADGRPEIIKLKVIPLEAKYLRSLPIHPSQKEIETTDEYSIFTLFLAPTWDFKQDLLSRADQVEVLEPESLREWMKEMTRKMSLKYY